MRDDASSWLQVRRLIQAPAPRVWEALTDTRQWPRWGPSVREATLASGASHISEGATGRVRVVGGLWLPFVITQVIDGRRWRWRVLGLAITDHQVREVGADACEVSFGVAPWAAPYALVCALALRRLSACVAR